MRVGLRRVPVAVPSAEIELALTDQLVGVEQLGDVVQLLVVGPLPDASPRVTSCYRAVHLPVGVAQEVDDTMSVEVAGTYMQEGYRLTALCVLGRVRSIAREVAVAARWDANDTLASSVVTEPARQAKAARPAPKGKPHPEPKAKRDGPTLKDRIVELLNADLARKFTGREIATTLAKNGGAVALMVSQLVREGRVQQDGDGLISAPVVPKPSSARVVEDTTPASEFREDEL